MIRIGASTIKAAKEFEEQRDRLQRMGEMAGLEADTLLEEAKEVARTTTMTFAEAADYVLWRAQSQAETTHETLERADVTMMLFDPAYRNSSTGQWLWFSICVENFKHTLLRDFPLCILARKILRWLQRGE